MGKDRRFVSPVIINIRGKSLQNVKLGGRGGPRRPPSRGWQEGRVLCGRPQPPPGSPRSAQPRCPQLCVWSCHFAQSVRKSTKEGTRWARPGSSARRIRAKNRNTIFHINGFDFSRHLKKTQNNTAPSPPLQPQPPPRHKKTHPCFHPSTHPSSTAPAPWETRYLDF